jgi:hypothetical protein
MLKRLKRKLHNIKFYLKHGFAEHEVWDLGDHMIRWLLPRLKVFRNNVNSYPSSGMTYQEWIEVLDDIIWSFEHKDEIGDQEITKRIYKGYELFGKYWECLWD